jgi:sulfur-carrier protein
MKIHALFFASYREIAGTDELTLDLPDGASVTDLVVELRARGAVWRSLPSEPAVAVNLTYSKLNVALSEGDEVAFIPPVSGG